MRGLLAIVVLLGALGAVGGMVRLAATAQDDPRLLPSGHEKITAAMPTEALVQPAQARRLLVYTACKGFVHSSIPQGKYALLELGRRTRAFEPYFSEDPADFRPARLREFDAVCFLNTTGELFDDPELKTSLLEFVRGGRGLIGIHAATDAFYNWPEYGAMLGGYFAGHPWNAGDEVVLRVEDVGHPLTKMFPEGPFDLTEEIYQFREPYSRAQVRVLVGLDPARTDMQKPGVNRPDGDFPISWVRREGLGRVFYCSLGHNEHIFWNPVVLRHYLAGIQYALGDLPAAALPSAQVQKDGWLALFNGTDLNGWHAPQGSWSVDDGTLARRGGGDIWTQEMYGDFELELEFKLAPQTNSGIFFRTVDLRDPVQTGIELQVLDSYGKAEVGKHDAGAIYDCLAPRVNAVRPPGEWNRVRLVCRGSRIEADLNGEPIIRMDLDEWTEAGRNPDGTPNKFRTAYKEMPRRGHLGFQDHGKPVWYRNIRLRPLK